MRLTKTGNPPHILRLITPFFFGRAKQIDSVDRSVFIVSSGRTGTKFIADYFSQFEDVKAVHEPKPSRILRMWTTARLEGKVDNDVLSGVLYKKRRSLEREAKTHIYIESNPYLSGFVGSFDGVFKNSIVIHIIRDPRDYVKSAANHGNFGGIKNLFNSHVPFWYPDVAKINGLKDKITPKMRVACYWKEINEFLSDEGSKLGNYHLLKFEDIFDSSGSGLKQLEEIIGLQPSPKNEQNLAAINKSRGSAVDSWQSWSSAECRQMDKLWQPLAKKHGYCQDKAWRDKVSG